MTILWSINDRNGTALPLDGKEVHLYYTNNRGRHEADIEIQDSNVIVWHFLNKDQRVLGSYTLTVEILSNENRAIKKDICDAFTLVGKECEESYDSADAYIYDGGEITLTTDLDIYRISPIIPYIVEDESGVGYWYVDGINTGQRSKGETAYEYAVSQGYEGSEQDFAALQASLQEQVNGLVERVLKLENIINQITETTDD